jgi:transcription termination factor Rho
MSPKEALEFILSLLRKHKTNDEIMEAIENQKAL